ncbi:DUF4350 domain-containing protein [Streptomyces sp. NPDC005805]|uniref:DUF4350 domain-containing protein n=1 Tax=Streptomyces sp. NPDC005805 TaxID=3157068 RepID=UPI0033D26F3A
MTTTSPTSLSPTGRQVWTRTRGLLAVLALLVVAGITIAALQSGGRHGRLDPRSVDPTGSRAVAELLKREGVAVRPVTSLPQATAAAGPDATLLVTDPNLLSEPQLRELRATMSATAGRTVLLSPDAIALDVLAPDVDTDAPARVAPRDPQCSYPAARRAGDADLGGERYRTDLTGADACYPSGGLPTLLRLDNTSGGGDTVLLGAPNLLYNDRLDEHGNASLALQLLGSRNELIWYIPSLSDTSVSEEPRGDGGDGDPAGDAGASGESTFLDLVPEGWIWGTLQLTVAAVLAAVWRGRRLGPLVTERLPVAVRASEATEGRSRLYRKTNARDRAASSLRTASRTRLGPLLGVAPSDVHSAEKLLPALSALLPDAGRDFHALLFGPAPDDDLSLINLADQLDALEREVRTP